MKIQDPREKLQLIVSLATAGNRAAAVAAVGELADKHVAAEAWRLLAELNANMQRWGEASSDLEIALQHDPESVPLRLWRALLREQSGDAAGALAELGVLAREIRV
jgi:uncharacterized protein HemY